MPFLGVYIFIQTVYFLQKHISSIIKDSQSTTGYLNRKAPQTVTTFLSLKLQSEHPSIKVCINCRKLLRLVIQFYAYFLTWAPEENIFFVNRDRHVRESRELHLLAKINAKYYCTQFHIYLWLKNIFVLTLIIKERKYKPGNTKLLFILFEG